MQPRDYQIACREAVLETWGLLPSEREQFRTLLITLCTSAGKTIISGDLINIVQAHGRCLYLADTDELCAQPARKFWRMFQIRAAVEKAGERASKHSPVVIASAQTLARPQRLERFAPDHFQFIFVDEAHRGSDRNKKITDHFPAARVCGMTATPFRAKLKDLSGYYETVAFEMGVFDLIHEGYITPIKVLTLPVEVNISEVRQSMSKDGMDYNAEELSTSIRPYFERIIDLIIEHASNRQILVFLPLIRSSIDFASACAARGLTARHVDGQSRDRQQLLEAFSRKQFQILTNSSLLTTGWDCESVDCLLNLAPTRSEGLFRQKVGRIVRTLEGVVDGLRTAEERRAAIAACAKPDALILDLLWQTERFGLVGAADLIAVNEDERVAIERAIKEGRTAEDLEDVAKAVQEAREAALRDALEEAAKRRSRFTDTVNMIAALLHDRDLMNYEPASKWEEAPITEKQAEFMAKNGIDPASASGRGHASALMNLLFGRRKAGLCSARAVAALEKEGFEGAISMTEVEAYRCLGALMPFPFGKHAGKPFGQVPSGYWEWLAKQQWVRYSWPTVWMHLRDVENLVEGSTHDEPTMFDVLP